MAHVKKNNWIISDFNINSLIFAQKLTELSFDYTSYIHKANRPSARFLASEILKIVTENKESQHSSYIKEIEYIKNELIERIKDDIIARKLIGINRENYISSLNDPNDFDNIINCMQLLIKKVSIEKYLTLCVEELKIYLHCPKEKIKFVKLVENFFEVCIEAGYQQGTIYYLTKTYFYDQKTRREIRNPTDIDDFFDYFDLKKSKYSVIFKVHKDFEIISDSFQAFNVEIIENISKKIDYNKFRKFCNNRKKSKIFIECKEISAVDYLEARKKAEAKLVQISNILSLFRHKQSMIWEHQAIVTHLEKNNSIIANQPNNPFINIADNKLHIANTKFVNLTENLRLKNDSFRRFNRSLSFHSLAGKISDPMNQLVNLWTCFEILLFGSKSGSKIDTIERRISYFIIDAYIPYLIYEITNELINWNSIETHELLMKTINFQNGDNDIYHSMAELITLKYHENIMTDFLLKMTEVPYLRLKLFFLINNLQKTKSIISLLDGLKLRIKWDIRRIYRARNSIVHAGHTPININHLVEISHTFLDIIFSVIYNENIYNNTISTIENAVTEYKFKRLRHDKLLQTKTECSKDNFLEIIFSISK